MHCGTPGCHAKKKIVVCGTNSTKWFTTLDPGERLIAHLGTRPFIRLYPFPFIRLYKPILQQD